MLQTHEPYGQAPAGHERPAKALRFIDLFAGIGGFHLALHRLGAECVFASEWDQAARTVYEYNFRALSPQLFDGRFAGDIQQVDPTTIPDFDLLCAGFPCQPFSQAGYKRGFGEARGTLFFNIVEILRKKRPAAFFLENVRHLKNHDGGRTFEIIQRLLSEELGYSFHAKIVKASDFGLPQHRPRLFMVGFADGSAFEFPRPHRLTTTLSQILGGKTDRDIGYTLRVGGRGSGIDDRRNWDTYRVDGKVVRIGPDAARKLQGFPDDFSLPASQTQAMKQLGNAVAVPAVRAVAKQIIDALSHRIGIDAGRPGLLSQFDELKTYNLYAPSPVQVVAAKRTICHAEN